MFSMFTALESDKRFFTTRRGGDRQIDIVWVMYSILIVGGVKLQVIHGDEGEGAPSLKLDLASLYHNHQRQKENVPLQSEEDIVMQGRKLLAQ